MQELPTQDIDVNAIYLVPIADPQTSDNYAEYIYLNGVWEKLGETPIEIDLTDYVKNTDYATSNKGGVVKMSNANAIRMGATTHVLETITKTYDEYNNMSYVGFIGKSTLENVITGKGLVSNTDYASTSKGGVVKTNASNFATALNTNGVLYAITKTYNDYEAMSNQGFIGKGTLENVLSARYKPQVVLTQAEYDAITTPDENTLYIIKEA